MEENTNPTTFEDLIDDIEGRVSGATAQAKRYIVANYAKVIDWSGLWPIQLRDREKKKHYFSPASKPTDIWYRPEDKGNPVVAMTDVFLDESDYDLSMKINGFGFWPIPWMETLRIAACIENFLIDNNITADDFKSDYDSDVFAIG